MGTRGHGDTGSADRNGQVLIVPLGALPPAPITYCLRQTLFKMAEAARKGVHKDMAKALEESGRGIRVEAR